MKISSGLVIICENKILLAHPTNASWHGTYSFPKGGVELNETVLEAAIRETQEEIGIKIPLELIDKTERFVEYIKNDKITKKVYYFIVRLTIEQKTKLFQNGMKLQTSELDYADFITKEEAKDKIFWRFNELLELI
jgi:ADP-ribose pyrophosphatase YjhB (NUDIX family)